MTVQTTSNLTNSLRTQYVADYLDRIYGQRLYDQIASPIGGISPEQAMQGATVQVDFLSSMSLVSAVISQTADMTPSILFDATASTSVTSRGAALQWAENLDIQVYTDYAMRRIEKLADNAVESIEVIANFAATTGTFVERAAARASLDAGTAAHRASDSIFRQMHGKMLSLRVPGFRNEAEEANTFAAIMHPYVFHDVSESGNVDAIGTYQDKGIHLNFELGQVGPFRLVVSPNAKTFFGAGAANADTTVTSVNSATSPLATSFNTSTTLTSAGNLPEIWTIGTLETGDVHYPMNEQIQVGTAVTSSIISSFVGTGENGGLRFAHASTDTVNNSDSVYTVVFGGPDSLYKLYAPSVGEFGEVVGPKVSGLAEQFASVAWKFYGNYGRLTENRLVRGEYSTSYEA
jgi:hypothetical protein